MVYFNGGTKEVIATCVHAGKMGHRPPTELKFYLAHAAISFLYLPAAATTRKKI